MVIDGKYYIFNIESGDKIEVSKEYCEAYIEVFKSFIPRIDSDKGSVIVFGTTGEMNGNEDLKKIFYEPENYKLK